MIKKIIFKSALKIILIMGLPYFLKYKLGLTDFLTGFTIGGLVGITVSWLDNNEKNV